jgi:addiction module RelE/StbE family toxin
MRIVWLDRAQNDLDQVAEFVMQNNPAAALKVVVTIRESTQVLSVHPELGRIGRVEGTRELVIPGLPYILPYQVVDSEVRILAVMHTARKWPDSF